jgi:hypothetical protein
MSDWPVTKSFTDRVADGENVRVARAHVLVDAEASALDELEPGRLGERRLSSSTHATSGAAVVDLAIFLFSSALTLCRRGLVAPLSLWRGDARLDVPIRMAASQHVCTPAQQEVTSEGV